MVNPECRTEERRTCNGRKYVEERMEKMNNRYIRQQDLVDAKIFKRPVTIVGVGGIGSFLTLTLGKMGFNDITVFDDDLVEEHNLPNQFYREVDVVARAYKTDSLKSIVKDFTGINVKSSNRKWLSTFNSKGILISAVDNMDTREAMFNYAIEKQKNVPFFIDGRMGRLQAEVYTVKTDKKSDIVTYKKRLWRADQVAPIRCTEKAIIYNVLFIASMICSQLKLALEGKIYKPAIIADLENTDVTFFK